MINHFSYISKRIIYFITLLSSFSLLFFCLFPTFSFAATPPKLVTQFGAAFLAIKSWLLTISTPIAAVSIIIGFLMKKLSFGDEERIRMGKKLVRNSIVSYIFILLIDLIIDAIQFITN